MTLEQRERIRISKLAEQVIASIKQAEKDVWNRKCRSDRPIKLARTDRTTAPVVILPQCRQATSSQPANTNGRDFHAVKTVGLAGRKKGYRFPKAGCKSMAKLIKRSALLESGLPSELVDCIMKDQASRIRIPKEKFSRVERIAEFLGISLREAMLPEYENFELA